MEDLNIHYIAVVGVKTKKPNTTFFHSVIPEFSKKKLFYVGDASGDKDVWSDVDKKFAQAIGVEYFTPEQVFSLKDLKYPMNLKVL